VRAVVRRSTVFPAEVETVVTGDLLPTGLPQRMFDECDAAINCVARVHIMRETEADPERAYLSVNSDLALALLDGAAESGVRRFVQLSSVAAVTSVTPAGTIVDDTFDPRPHSPYGRSKLDADLRLQQRSAERGIAVVSLRPPTVFGPGVGAYFRMLMRCAKIGIPLPVGAVENRRSFIFSSNIADAVLTAADGKGEGSFIVTDSPPLSTADLYRSLLHLYRRPVLIPRVAAPLVRGMFRLVLGGRADSLLCNSAYDGSRFEKTFDWTPPVAFDEALARTVGNGTW
jgi:UDP-glucose 4-epimerase